MRFDLHLHTRRHSPDSEIDPFILVQRARELGLAGVVITEHDWLWTPSELDELRRAAPGLQVYSGIEVTAAEGHFLVHGVSDPFRVAKGIGVAELCREVHRQGGVVVAAHPFRWGQPFDDVVHEEQPELDGLELKTSSMDDECRWRADVVWKAKGWAGLGSSDAHDHATIGCCSTEFATPVGSYADLIAAIRRGQTRAVESFRRTRV